MKPKLAYPPLTPQRIAHDFLRVVRVAAPIAIVALTPRTDLLSWAAVALTSALAVALFAVWVLPRLISVPSAHQDDSVRYGPHTYLELLRAWRDPNWRCRELGHRLDLPDADVPPRKREPIGLVFAAIIGASRGDILVAWALYATALAADFAFVYAQRQLSGAHLQRLHRLHFTSPHPGTY